MLPLPEQHAIARILGTLDDKIELNRRMNETLEAMARALFKSWFVDFDPVRAKMEGRDTGLPSTSCRSVSVQPTRRLRTRREMPEGWILGSGLPDTGCQLPQRRLLKAMSACPETWPVYGSKVAYPRLKSVDRAALVGDQRLLNGDKHHAMSRTDFLQDGSVFWAPHGCWPYSLTPRFHEQIAHDIHLSAIEAIRFREYAIQSMTGSGRRVSTGESVRAVLEVPFLVHGPVDGLRQSGPTNQWCEDRIALMYPRIPFC